MRIGSLIVLFLLAASSAWSALPPSLLNYQGVLRNPTGTPLAGAYDMVFSFYDAATGGSEILVDSHLFSGTGSVTVSNGLFNVILGGGSVTDGAGTGSYTSLDPVFRDYGAVWMEIQVGPANGSREVLSPLIRIVSSAYALNAGKLAGLTPGTFLDTSGSGQTKAGSLTCQNGLIGSGTFGVYATGTSGGGAFSNNDLTSLAFPGYAGLGLYGIRADGSDAGGFFRDSDNTGMAYLGYGGIGIEGSGNVGGTFFTQGSTGIGDLAAGDRGIFAHGNVGGASLQNSFTGSFANLASQYGLDATGIYCSSACGAGGRFQNSPNTGRAFAGYGETGLWAAGSSAGGEFVNDSSSGYAHVAFGDFGIVGQGTLPIEGFGGGGYFYDPDWGSYALLGYGNTGVWGSGSSAGGDFLRQNNYLYDEAWAATGGDGVRGWSQATHIGGQFRLGGTSIQASVAFLSGLTDLYTLNGNGLKAFSQNDPSDPSRQIVYVALEGAEAGTYTRGTGRIQRGRALVKLDPAFASVTNPDIGLTALVTSRGGLTPLAVSSISTEELTVQAAGPEEEGTVFDFIVYGLRMGFEQHPSLQPKTREEPIPPAPTLPADPRSALARFVAMRLEVGETAPPDFSRSDAMAAAARGVAVREPGDEPAGSEAPPAASPAVFFPPGLSVPIPVTTPLFPGDVAAFDAADPSARRLVRATGAAGEILAGIVGGSDPAIAYRDAAPLSLGGSLSLCQVDASSGAIRVGDLLSVSMVPGRAGRSSSPASGTILAKAMESMPTGSGLIHVLVMSR